MKQLQVEQRTIPLSPRCTSKIAPCWGPDRLSKGQDLLCRSTLLYRKMLFATESHGFSPTFSLCRRLQSAASQVEVAVA
eukprot:CAMPEP_0195018480 /NCGR_PEP_ID=MMETSP0326_2-20130528/30358_1 /TAXON_ID=2866 ORGANISM="Crypthecodinium cohnii, Strain Seligo" /NCGR_SAMPLE_ID=MMETSP0326_2 /ASSEMBLY_ACC=CAM_ASM_000348 /LENGTH=78 /DNA_ID=CAMNT_0040035945 /DNA_START=31 /DNA_END=263 /DNA_ORIENTATION=-